MTVFWILLFVALPAVLISLCGKAPLINKIGVVLLCYIHGMVFGNFGLLPDAMVLAADGGDSVLSLMQSITICLAMPLVLFSLDIRGWYSQAKRGMLSMLFACVSVMIVAFAVHLAIGRGDPQSPQLAAAAVAVYTGGTVNLGAIREAVGMSASSFIVFNTYDAVICIIYIAFVSTAGRRFFRDTVGLPEYKSTGGGNAGGEINVVNESPEAYRLLTERSNLPGLLAAFGISVLIFGVSYLLNMLVSMRSESLGMAVMMLSITTISIACSFSSRIRSIRGSFQLGMYLIYVFCISVAASADFSQLLHFEPVVFAYVLFATFGSLFVHSLLCRAAKIDADTMIITSVAAICSPPFVPQVAASLGNREVMVTGIAAGIIGYALGNYLGIFVNGLLTLI